MIDRDCLRVLVQGRLACFTRPELSSERTTYPCLTPSAAEGVLKSIYWKPEFMYEIEGITVRSVSQCQELCYAEDDYLSDECRICNPCQDICA